MRKDARTHCRDCDVELNEFNTVWSGLQSKMPRCRECNRIHDKERARIARETDNWKNTRYKSTYGITLEEYNRLFELHQGGCAICRQPCESGKKLSVDHNHKTGEVRGLLCLSCNLALSNVKEDEDIIWNMLEYLKRTTWNKKKEVA